MSGKTLLTPRETDVAIAACDGLSNIEVGERLGITADTVRTHLNLVYRVLGVRNRLELVAAVWKLGLLPHCPSCQRKRF